MSRDKEPRLPTNGPDGRRPARPPAEPTIDRPSQTRIGDHLRAMYDGLMQQPVPDRFVDLLNQLDKGGEGDGRGPR